jgi:sulfatase maturation enzyme AslB (radical SAM superfamily)
MAIGFSGSNGGIRENNLKQFISNKNSLESLEVSYFVNNICNLKCKHCYVGYNNVENELTIEEWKNVFNDLIQMGALTFGNVGKEPLLTWNKTKELMLFLNEKRNSISKLRFGLVTNATLMNKEIINELSDILPDYIDVSLDGTKKINDYIRGKGNFDKTINNLKLMQEYPELYEKIFISFTLMNINKEDLPKFLKTIHNLGLKNLLISPFVQKQKENGNLYLPDKKVAEVFKNIANGEFFNFKKFNNLEIILKNDYDTTKKVMDKLVEKNVIDIKNLLIDEYGVIFNKYEHGTSKVILNFMPVQNTFTKQIRISHDGYISDCYSMFFKDYPKRKGAIGNLKEKSVSKILNKFI